MPRLSIVIPCVQDAAQFEWSLASVLQNRPADCEVLVVLPQAYDDPYDLRAEVRFLQAPAESTAVDLINVGVQAATGSIVHILTPDVDATDGWTDAAGAHFDNPAIGSVSPLVVAEEGGRVIARGVHHSAGGRRRVCVRKPTRGRAQRDPVIGPTLVAGFYRRQAVLDVGGFCRGVGEELADVDLACALHAIGMQSVHEETSVVTSRTPGAVRGLSWEHGRRAERLFWRNASAAGWWRAVLLHGWTIVCEVAGNLFRPALLPHLLGRVMATCEFADFRRRHRQLQAIRKVTPSSESGVLSFPRSPGLTGQDRSSRRTAA